MVVNPRLPPKRMTTKREILLCYEWVSSCVNKATLLAVLMPMDPEVIRQDIHMIVTKFL